MIPVIQQMDELKKQDELRCVAGFFAARPGIVTDEFVRAAIDEIKLMPRELQFDAFELLDVQTQNGHAHGMAADVRKEIFCAWDLVTGDFSLTPPSPAGRGGGEGDGKCQEVDDVCE